MPSSRFFDSLGHLPAVGLSTLGGACTADGDYRIRVQRVRCKVCGRTHSLLPDFVHPHRLYGAHLLQLAVSLYLIAGLGWGCLMKTLETERRSPDSGPAHSTVREWVGSSAYGAGELLLDFLLPQLLAFDPLTDVPDTAPLQHLDHISDLTKRRRSEHAHHFWLLAEQLYALVKVRLPRLHLTAAELFPFLLFQKPICRPQTCPESSRREGHLVSDRELVTTDKPPYLS